MRSAWREQTQKVIQELIDSNIVSLREKITETDDRLTKGQDIVLQQARCQTVSFSCCTTNAARG